MNPLLKTELLELAKKYSHDEDPAHDFEHILRVLRNAEIIATKEGADIDIVIPAALFHDLVNYPKNHPKAKLSSNLSAQKTGKLLGKIKNYPKHKIPFVEYAISCCSFTKGIVPTSLEGKVHWKVDDTDKVITLVLFSTCYFICVLRFIFCHLQR